MRNERRRTTRRRNAAVLLLALLSALPRMPADAAAGPLEARRLYDAARASKTAPWPVAVRAYRLVLSEAGRADPLRPRALKAIAGIFSKAGLPHGAQAAFHSASRAGWRSDNLASLQLACARSLLSECDLDAARALLAEVAAHGSRRAPRETSAALDLLAEEAYDRAHLPKLAAWVAQMESERVPHAVRMEAYGRLGQLHVGAGARKEAERCLLRARRLYEESRSVADRKASRRALKVWMDLPLRGALED